MEFEFSVIDIEDRSAGPELIWPKVATGVNIIAGITTTVMMLLLVSASQHDGIITGISVVSGYRTHTHTHTHTHTQSSAFTRMQTSV